MYGSKESISQLLSNSNKELIGFGYRQLKNSAELAAQQFGCEWAKRTPSTNEAMQLRQEMRDLVMSHIPKGHSNRDVVWQRYRQYALNFCSQASTHIDS